VRIPALCLLLIACESPLEVTTSTVERVHYGDSDAADTLSDLSPSDTSVPETASPETTDTSIFEEIDAGPEVPFVPETATPPAPVPQLSAAELATLDASMKAALNVAALSGRTFGGLAVDLETGQTLWASDPDRAMIPASNTKIFTTAAALARLGPEHRMVSRLVSTGTIDANGTLNGTLELHSAHDFTWSRWFHKSERTPLDRMVEALYRKGLRKVSGNLGVSGAYLYDGYHLGGYDTATHRQRAGSALLAALNARGISVTGTLQYRVTMDLPAGTELARWESNTLEVAEWPINHISHNEMADILLRHLAYEEDGESDYEVGGDIVRDWLAEVGIDTAGFDQNDGSGLATSNRISARHMVGLYRYMVSSSLWRAFRSTLTIGGAGGPGATDGASKAIVTENSAPYNGTFANRMTNGNIAGRVFGKSGTNAGITTSGVLHNRFDGHRYAFAFLMNNISQSQYGSARATQDALVAVLGKDHRGRGTRPATPTLGCVIGRPDGKLEVHIAPLSGFSPADGSAGFRVEVSPDGERWTGDAIRTYFTVKSPLILKESGKVHMRVIAVNTIGESDPSDIYAVRVLPGAPRVLIVDANDRWQSQPVAENTLGTSHAFVNAYAQALPEGIAFDTCPDERVSGTSLLAWDAVLWAAAEDGAADESVSASEAAVLGDYLSQNGSLFISGAEVAWDLDPSGNASATAADKTFLEATLRTSYVSDDAGTFTVEGTAAGLFSDRTLERRLSFWTPGHIFVAYPDVLRPRDGATSCLDYLGTSDSACTQYQGEYDVVQLGFPFESIDGATERALVMSRVLEFFGL
jgi:D-alanyl-D-alanine carboxypeptidase/D-alanyl-D-alanine-endopeptidase (penicillin-binding protein 4)